MSLTKGSASRDSDNQSGDLVVLRLELEEAGNKQPEHR